MAKTVESLSPPPKKKTHWIFLVAICPVPVLPDDDTRATGAWGSNPVDGRSSIPIILNGDFHVRIQVCSMSASAVILAETTGCTTVVKVNNKN